MLIGDIIVLLFYFLGIFGFAISYKGLTKFSNLFLLIGFIHISMTIAYYMFSLNNPADAIGYFYRARDATQSWLSFFGQDISFIVFLTYPFVKWFGLSYFATTMVFSFLGLIGFYFIIEVLRSLTLNYWTNWYYLLLLPNLHFWTVGLGKDSIIFMAMSMLLYNVYFKKSLIYYMIPFFLIGFIRVHILVFLILAYGFTMIFINQKIRSGVKFALGTFLLVILILLMPLFVERLNISEEKSLTETIEYFDNLESMGGSGVDMRGKNIVVKWFSFMFRPFFFDIHSILTLIASFENIFWIIIVYSIVLGKRIQISSKLNVDFWLSIFIVLVVTIPSAFGLYNLGIAMRQKYMVFPFLIVAFFISVYGTKRTSIIKFYLKRIGK